MKRPNTLEDIGRQTVDLYRLIALRTKLRARDRQIPGGAPWPEDRLEISRKINRARNTLHVAVRAYGKRMERGS